MNVVGGDGYELLGMKLKIKLNHFISKGNERKLNFSC